MYFPATSSPECRLTRHILDFWREIVNVPIKFLSFILFLENTEGRIALLYFKVASQHLPERFGEPEKSQIKITGSEFEPM